MKHIQANPHAFAALRGDGSVVTWGHLHYGGDSSAVQEQLQGVKQIQAASCSFAAIKADGSIVSWGLDCGSRGRTFSQMSAEDAGKLEKLGIPNPELGPGKSEKLGMPNPEFRNDGGELAKLWRFRGSRCRGQVRAWARHPKNSNLKVPKPPKTRDFSNPMIRKPLKPQTLQPLVPGEGPVTPVAA